MKFPVRFQVMLFPTVCVCIECVYELTILSRYALHTPYAMLIDGVPFVCYRSNRFGYNGSNERVIHSKTCRTLRFLDSNWVSKSEQH